MVYELFVTQRNDIAPCSLCGGAINNWSNCTCASHAQWLYRASQGRISTTSCHVRDLTNDCVGGTNLNQMVAVSAMYGITTGKLYQPVAFSQLVSWIQTGRYGSHLNISYAPFVGTPYDRFHGGFSGNHDVFLSNKGGTSTTLRTGDPGATGFVDIPIALLGKAAGLLDVGGQTLNAQSGIGKCYAYVTPIDPIGGAPHYTATVIVPTSLWNETTQRWVYNGVNKIKIGVKFDVRGATYTKGGVVCYPISGPAPYINYYLPRANVRLS